MRPGASRGGRAIPRTGPPGRRKRSQRDRAARARSPRSNQGGSPSPSRPGWSSTGISSASSTTQYQAQASAERQGEPVADSGEHLHHEEDRCEPDGHDGALAHRLDRLPEEQAAVALPRPLLLAGLRRPGPGGPPSRAASRAARGRWAAWRRWPRTTRRRGPGSSPPSPGDERGQRRRSQEGEGGGQERRAQQRPVGGHERRRRGPPGGAPSGSAPAGTPPGPRRYFAAASAAS